MVISFNELFIALPEIFLLTAICVLLLVDVLTQNQASRRTVLFYTTQIILIFALLITLYQYNNFIGPVLIFSKNYIVDKLALLAKLVIIIFSFLAFAYARTYLDQRKIATEYYLLGLFAVLGMLVMASASSFLTIYLGLELMSICLYAMIAMYKDNNVTAEAAMKYFVLGALASGLLLYGISILYGLTGSIQLNAIATLIENQFTIVPVLALIFIIAGLIFKFGAVPFHMWVPDVYQGAPAPVALFIASAPKVAAFVITFRVLVEALPNLLYFWLQMLIFIAVLSMFLGNALAIAQTNLKRLLAYSSIAHIGYVLLGLIAGPYSQQGYNAAMFYMITYVLVAAGTFAVITAVSQNGIELERIEDYRGLNTRNPWLAFLMLILLFSLAGVPPTVGFIAKLGLIEALIQADMAWLAILAMIFSVIGLYYYLRIVMTMYFEEPTIDHTQAIVLSQPMLITLSINSGAALLLGIMPSYLISLCQLTVS